MKKICLALSLVGVVGLAFSLPSHAELSGTFNRTDKSGVITGNLFTGETRLGYIDSPLAELRKADAVKIFAETQPKDSKFKPECLLKKKDTVQHAQMAKSYRAKLERSGCTQVTELQGCDIHKTKAQNEKAGHGSQSLGAVSAYAESIIGADIDHAADALLADGWKPNNGDWHKGKYILRLVVENKIVVNAQVM